MVLLHSRVGQGPSNGAPANLSVTFSASALTAAPARLTKVAGDGQNAAAGTNVPTPPSVKVTDAVGNPIQGVLVTFAVTGGGGIVAPAVPVATGANGIAAVTSWLLTAVDHRSISITDVALK